MDGADSAWERSSVASGLQSGVAHSVVSSETSQRVNFLNVLPQPKHKYQISEDVIMQKEDEIMRLEEELLQKDEE